MLEARSTSVYFGLGDYFYKLRSQTLIVMYL